MSMPEILPMSERYQDYLHDESRLQGQAGAITFPEDAAQAAAALRWAGQQALPVTVQGGRTGITGGAVPRGGLILNLSRMTRIGPVTGSPAEGFSVTVEPGVLWQELDKALARRGLFFPPDPTETTATLGGMFGHNARGVCAHRWGATADYVQALTLLRPDGSALSLTRGECRFDATGCTLPDGTRLELGPLPPADGLPGLPAPGMDLLDLLAGSEGMLGVVVSLTLRVLPRPAEPWGLTFFFGSAEAALTFADGLAGQTLPALCCAEFYDAAALERVLQVKAQTTQLKDLPDFPPESRAALYLQLADADPDAVDAALLTLLDAFAAQGGTEDQSWAVSGESALAVFRQMRHAVPESVNASLDRLRQTCPQARKMGLDFACPGLSCREQYACYTRALEAHQVPGVMFGHAADRHLHCNLVPADPDQLARCPALLAELTAAFAAAGGTLCAENGVGKLKAAQLTFSPAQRRVLLAVRRCFDPDGCLNPGNFIPQP